MKFCGECGSALTATAPATPALQRASEPVAERRLVTVLFADLVGFTTASEGRDFEDVRDLQATYFETARTTIERHGGTVEKFIGDAVMAVWGAPVAREGDAERAARAALELVTEVAALEGDGLQLRAGLLTGEAAVTLGAEGQGMVTGDLVNTASRIQSVAEPGVVLAGDATKRASEAAIVYERVGVRELKGKADPVELWRVVRVVANRGGEGRSAGLEAPFVGRERELRVTKELFHATIDDRRARLVSVVGAAGMGKSRLAWEFEKYLDGLADDAYWHRGRCLAYGEGVAYWALAEMVRMRARITEDDTSEAAVSKLSTAVAEAIDDPQERLFVEPRLQHLLGLTERTAPDREDLFSAWRLFLERMTERFPVVMVFEDIHWADAALIEFIESLLDRSRNHPIFVLTFARPELAERHAGFGTRMPSFSSVTLEPLSDDAIAALLRGLVPGIDDDAIERISERAEGIPFYAVEIVRMLLDRGLLERDADGYRVTGDLTALEVPETLHTLIAARLDGLEPEERRLLQDGCVLGKTFSVRGVATLAGADEAAVLPTLESLVRKELLYLDTDPFSPERGQYGFLQALVQRVTYETLSRHDRKARHVAAARFLASDAALDPDEIAEVISAHLLDAFRLDEGADDGGEIRAQARSWLTRAGDRAMSLAAADEAQRAYEAAADLADDAAEQATLLEQAGDMARMGNRMDRAEELLRRAHAAYVDVGDTHAAARASAGIARAAWLQGRTAEAAALGEEAFAALGSDEPDADVGALAERLAALHYFLGDRELAAERVETALQVAERLRLPSLLSSALNTKALALGLETPHQAHGLLREALRIALEHDLVFEALRAYNNLLIALDRLDRVEEFGQLIDEAHALARRRGDSEWSDVFTSSAISEYVIRGRWDEAAEIAREYAPLTFDVSACNAFLDLAQLAWERGDVAHAKTWLSRATIGAADDRQWRWLRVRRERAEALLEGRRDEALVAAIAETHSALEFREHDLQLAQALEAVADTVREGSDRDSAEVTAAARAAFPDGGSRQITAQLARLQGVLAARAGDHDTAAERFGIGLAAARSLESRPWVAKNLVDYGDSLVADARAEDAAPLIAEGRTIAEQLRWTRLLTRIEQLEARRTEHVVAG
jgi:predicted ATPase/class 3 adenylate cyclase